jgi:uncharacterized membrane protein
VIPLVVMLGAILAARGVGALGWEPLGSWHTATRVGLALMFVFTAAAHFNRMRADLIRMVPPQLPNPAALVTFTGVVELAGAVGLLVPAVSRWAALGLILLLLALFPANVHAARTGLTIGGRPATALAVRLPMQLLWIGLLWWSAV